MGDNILAMTRASLPTTRSETTVVVATTSRGSADAPPAKRSKFQTPLLSRLDDNVLSLVFEFVGTGQYLFVAPTNHRFNHLYGQLIDKHGQTKTTAVSSVVETVTRAQYYFPVSRHDDDEYYLEYPPSPFCEWSYIMDDDDDDIYTRTSFEKWQGDICTWAANYGSLPVVQWARSTGKSWGMSLCRAAQNGHLEVLQWALTNGGSKWSHYVSSAAAKYGQLHVLQWAWENGAMDKFLIFVPLREAAGNGQVAVLQWALEQGLVENKFLMLIFESAWLGGQPQVLSWAFENGLRTAEGEDDFEDDSEWFRERCFDLFDGYSGKVEVLQWVRDRGFELEGWQWGSLWDKAATQGWLKTMKWATDNDMGWDERNWENACYFAADDGRSEVLEWARENDYNWDHNLKTFV